MGKWNQNWLFGLGLGALLVFSGCRESEIVRALGTSVNPEVVGLQVEWTQKPVLRVYESENDFDYGGRVRADGGLEWSVLRVQNVSDRTVSFILGEWLGNEFRLTSRYLVTRTDWMQKDFQKGVIPGGWVRRYESLWKASQPRILRESGRRDDVTPYRFSQEGGLPEFIALAPGEAAEVVVWVAPSQGPLLPSLKRSILFKSDFPGKTFLSVNPQLRHHAYHFEVLCRTDFSAAVRFGLYAVGDDGVSLQALQIGSPSNQRSLSSPHIPRASKGTCDHPNPPAPLQGIPIAF